MSSRAVFDIITAKKVKQVYSDGGTKAAMSLTVFEADLDAITNNFYMIGQVAIPGHVNFSPGVPSSSIVLVKPLPAADGELPVFKPPVDYQLYWTDALSKGYQDGSFWHVLPPTGYTALGDVVVSGHDKPSVSFTKKFACIRDDLLLPGQLGDEPIWNDKGSGSKTDGAIWEVQNGFVTGSRGLAGFFKVWNNYNKPNISVSVLPAFVNHETPQ